MKKIEELIEQIPPFYQNGLQAIGYKKRVILFEISEVLEILEEIICSIKNYENCKF